jgi:hypothetical protein
MIPSTGWSGTRGVIAATAVVTAAVCVGVQAVAGHARSTSNITLQLGDKVRIPSIGWGCSLSLVQGTASFSCSPGVPGSNSQGEPILVIGFKKASVIGGKKPAYNSIQTPKGPLRFFDFATTRR